MTDDDLELRVKAIEQTLFKIYKAKATRLGPYEEGTVIFDAEEFTEAFEPLFDELGARDD